MTDWPRSERNHFIEGGLLDEQDRLDWEAERDIATGWQHPPSDAEVADARAAIDRYTARCRAEDAELIELGRRQAYQAWLHERGAS